MAPFMAVDRNVDLVPEPDLPGRMLVGDDPDVPVPNPARRETFENLIMEILPIVPPERQPLLEHGGLVASSRMIGIEGIVLEPIAPRLGGNPSS